MPGCGVSGRDRVLLLLVLVLLLLLLPRSPGWLVAACSVTGVYSLSLAVGPTSSSLEAKSATLPVWGHVVGTQLYVPLGSRGSTALGSAYAVLCQQGVLLHQLPVARWWVTVVGVVTISGVVILTAGITV